MLDQSPPACQRGRLLLWVLCCSHTCASSWPFSPPWPRLHTVVCPSSRPTHTATCGATSDSPAGWILVNWVKEARVKKPWPLFYTNQLTTYNCSTWLDKKTCIFKLFLPQVSLHSHECYNPYNTDCTGKSQQNKGTNGRALEAQLHKAKTLIARHCIR